MKVIPHFLALVSLFALQVHFHSAEKQFQSPVGGFQARILDYQLIICHCHLNVVPVFPELLLYPFAESASAKKLIDKH